MKNLTCIADEPLERYLDRVSYLPSHNLLAIVTSTGETVVFTGKNTTTQKNGLQSFKPKANIVLDNDALVLSLLMYIYLIELFQLIRSRGR